MKTLNDILNESQTAQDTLLFLSMRERYRKEPMRIAFIRRAMKVAGVPTDAKDLHKLFISLEQAKYGKVIYFRKKPVKFVWAQNFIEVANEALQSKPSQGRLIEIKPNQKVAVKRPTKESKVILLVLPSGACAKVEVPKELDSRDLSTLAHNLKNMSA